MTTKANMQQAAINYLIAVAIQAPWANGDPEITIYFDAIHGEGTPLAVYYADFMVATPQGSGESEHIMTGTIRTAALVGPNFETVSRILI